MAIRTALAALGIAACGDPSLRIRVDHDDAYAPDVVKTVVSAYEPANTPDSFDCDGIAFGDVAQSTLDATRIDVVESDDEDGVLSGLSRTDLKLIVAEGFAADEQRIVAGCEDGEEIDGDVTVTVHTVPVVQIAISDVGIDQPFTAPDRDIEIGAVTLDTASNDPMRVDRRRVQWIAYGPKGGYPTEDTSTIRSDGTIETVDGLVTIAPPDPSRPGPIAAEVQVEWASTTPPRIPGFVSPTLPVTAAPKYEFVRVDNSTPACASRTNAAGLETVVCLNGPMGGTRDVIELRMTGGGFATPVVLDPSPGPSPDDTAFGLVVDPTNQQIWALEADGDWQGVAGTPDILTGDFCRSVNGCVPSKAIVIPGCGGDPPRVAVEVENVDIMFPRRVTLFDLDGTAVGDIETAVDASIATVFDPTLLGGGCVDEIGGPLRQAIVVASGNQNTNVAAVTCTAKGGWCEARWNSLGGVGFVASKQPAESHLIGSELDVNSIALVEWVVFREGFRYQLIERRRHGVAAAPPAIFAGMFDADEWQDLVWLLNIPAPGMRVGTRLQIALDTGDFGDPGNAAERGERLMGFSPARLNDLESSVVVVDIDNDGADDVVTYNQIEAVAYPMGITVP